MVKTKKIICAMVILLTMFISGCSKEEKVSACNTTVSYIEYTKDNILNVEVNSSGDNGECVNYLIQIPAIIDGNQIHFYEIINTHTDEVFSDIYYRIIPKKIVNSDFEFYAMQNPWIGVNTESMDEYKLGIYASYTSKDTTQIEDIIEIDLSDLNNLQAIITK